MKFRTDLTRTDLIRTDLTRTDLIRTVLLATGLLALTACGTTVAPGAGSAAASSAAPSATASVDYAARAAAAVERHDKLFPEIAARCAGKAEVLPTPVGTPAGLPTDPEARKYAENHGYKTQAGLTPASRCRGEAHAERIKAALGGPDGKGTPRTTEELRSLLTGLGYRPDGRDVYGSGPQDLAFVLSVPESGPCVTGYLGTPVRIEAHGVYLEGGCHEPRGGH
ncbi:MULTISPECIES: hypothetical protein [unclassified Streptomyces]|uniref:hypothetical protein n=1 Tax=unclassified Streptomyces TaxID=2593676 RepID=UPI002E2FF886|nr:MULTISPECIES: hypothetical protein [unclassified Streptomyces]WUC67531.1 hypothetical protein OG861_26775 [Streptomyces sp. NBC_00539]